MKTTTRTTKILFTALSFLFLGCGVEIQNPEDQELGTDDQTTNYTTNNTTNNTTNENTENDTGYEPYREDQPLYIRGSVSSGFNITVDGIRYDDSESYYTDQIERLEQEKIIEGYEGYELTFDAEVGLTDLKNGMTVFAEALGNEGYASETIVVADGTFKMQFPEDAAGDYRVRANKRIGVILRNEFETIYWCWNFSANRQLSLYPDSKPVILRNFDTRLTKYQCQARKTNALSIPKNPSRVVISDQPAQQAQIDAWDDEWEEEIVGNNDSEIITQEQIDAWDKEWQEQVVGVTEEIEEIEIEVEEEINEAWDEFTAVEELLENTEE